MSALAAMTLAVCGAIAPASPAPSAPPAELITQRVRENLTPKHVAATYSAVRRQIGALKAIPEPIGEALDSQYGASLDAMRAYLAQHLDNAEAMLESVDRAESKPPRNTVRAVEQAEALSRGIATPPTVQHLLTFDPTYSGRGLNQFEAGLVTTDRTDGSGAGDGLAFSIERPSSWMPTHTRGGASVYRIRSEAGAGLSYVVIRVLPLEQEHPTPEELRDRVMDPEVYPNRKLLRHATGEVFGTDATTCVFTDGSAGRRGASRSVNKHYLVVQNRHIIKVETSVTDLARSADALLPMDVIETEFDRVEPLFDELVRRMRVTEPG